jgi:hypothetical protein
MRNSTMYFTALTLFDTGAYTRVLSMKLGPSLRFSAAPPIPSSTSLAGVVNYISVSARPICRGNLVNASVVSVIVCYDITVVGPLCASTPSFSHSKD